MINGVQFCDVEDLEKITGLSNDELWENGFNLDDCDGIMIVDENIFPLTYDSDFVRWYPTKNNWNLYSEGYISDSLRSVLEDWEDYCVGCSYTKYNEKVYISKHHS